MAYHPRGVGRSGGAAALHILFAKMQAKRQNFKVFSLLRNVLQGRI